MHFATAARELGVRVQMVDLIAVVERGWEFHFPIDDASWVTDDRERIALDPRVPCYNRLIDLSSVSPSTAVDWHALINGFAGWLELSSGIVINRPGHTNDNATKPLHEALLASQGLQVPPSFSGSRKRDLLKFVGEGVTIAKALCGQRADCRIVTVSDFRDYHESSGPVHLQRYVRGNDVRAHVIGDSVVTASIKSDGIDYRLDRNAKFSQVSLPEEVNRQLIAVTAKCGLAFAGWDLRVSAGSCWVLEMNPMPGYNFYDKRLSGAITKTLVEYLIEQ